MTKKDAFDVMGMLDSQEKEKVTNKEELQKNPRAVLDSEFNEQYNQSGNKSETHKRRTFLIDADISDKIDKLSAGKHGFKSLFVNKALEHMLTYYDDELGE